MLLNHLAGIYVLTATPGLCCCPEPLTPPDSFSWVAGGGAALDLARGGTPPSSQPPELPAKSGSPETQDKQNHNFE